MVTGNVFVKVLSQNIVGLNGHVVVSVNKCIIFFVEKSCCAKYCWKQLYPPPPPVPFVCVFRGRPVLPSVGVCMSRALPVFNEDVASV